MSVLGEIQVLYHLTLAPIRGETHAERMESFYGGQARAYDGFREHLLQGRKELWQRLPLSPGMVLVDMGGGTGGCAEWLEPRTLAGLGKLYIVDLCPSLLGVARDRIRRKGWTNVEPVLSDVRDFWPSEGAADVVTLSYSLTMMPDWHSALEHARRMLRPGGIIAVVDFYVSRGMPEAGHRRHHWITRQFWPAWFSTRQVFPSPDHVPRLFEMFNALRFSEHRARLRYLPVARAPYYRFIGRKGGSGVPAPGSGRGCGEEEP